MINNLAIIPARGGSKRIEKKNIKLFCGKEIIIYSIINAIKSGLFSEIIVSTDDLEIAEIAKKNGAAVPFLRSKKNSNDHSTTMDVIFEVVDEYKKLNKTFSNVCCIYPTSPLLTKNELREGLEMLKSGTDLVYPVTEFSYPVKRGLIINKDGYLKMKWPKFKNVRSQDLQKMYHDAGRWYWFSEKGINFKKFKKAKPYLLKNILVQDIDNLEDWEVAEFKYKYLKRQKKI